MKFYIVDAFTNQIFGGNPAGVVILGEGAEFPNAELMRKTAAELRYSETAFIKQLSDAEFDIRYFTPAAEVDLCGHATVGSFKALLEAGIVKDNSSYIINTLAGRLNIVITDGFVMMDMGEPKAFEVIDEAAALEELAKVMGLTAEQLGVEDGELYPQLVSTGLTDIMMPVRTKADLTAIAPDFPALSALSEKYNVTGVHAFTLDQAGTEKETVAQCRNFAPLYDIDEEAATGTSNGALTYYLHLNQRIRPEATNRFLQGESMERPSEIMSQLFLEGEDVKIKVGGDSKVLACGEIALQ